MGSFTPPSYINAGVRVGRLIYLEEFITTVHNAGYAYIEHTSGHDGLTGLNPNIPADSTIPVTTGDAATTGCFAWWGGSGEWGPNNELKKQLKKVEDDFRNLAKNNIIYGQQVSNFLTEYFWRLCRVCGQRYSWYIQPDSSTVNSWSGIGLKDTPYYNLSGYRTETYNIVKDLIESDSKGLRNIIYANESSDKSVTGITKILENLMIFNSSCEKWYDYGLRNYRFLQEGRQFLREWCADHGWWLAIQSNINRQKAAKWASEQKPPISNWWIHDVPIAAWGYYTFFHCWVYFKQWHLKAQNPTVVEYNIHGGYILTMISEPKGAGTLSPSEGIHRIEDLPVFSGNKVSVSQTPTGSYTFSYWSSNVKDGVVIMDKSQTVVAKYRTSMYSLATTIEPESKYGYVMGAGEYQKNSKISAIASPAQLNSFLNWKIDDGTTSTDNPLKLTMSRDYSVTAVFSTSPWLTDKYERSAEIVDASLSDPPVQLQKLYPDYQQKTYDAAYERLKITPEEWYNDITSNYVANPPYLCSVVWYSKRKVGKDYIVTRSVYDKKV